MSERREKRKYYHFEDDLLKYPTAWCIVVWSKRGPGKTYSTLLYGLEEQIPFIYMRRTDRSVNRILEDNDSFDTSPYAPIERDHGYLIEGVKIDDGFGAFYKVKDGEKYDFAFSTYGTGEETEGLSVFEEEKEKCIYVDIPRMSGVILKKSSDGSISLS